MATLVTARSRSTVRYLNPLALVSYLWHYRDLLRQFTRREVEGRYRGSFLGVFWSFVNPLLLLLLYTFVFGIVFQARWPESRTTNIQEYALVLFCGITIFSIFGECMNRAPGLIVGVPNYVKKVVFPLEMLPIVVLPLVFLCLGMTWFLASLGVFIRDSNYVIGLLVQMLFFTSAIFYAPASLPEPFRSLQAFNPMVSIVENFRCIILWGTLPSWPSLALWLPLTGLIMLLGYAWFMKTKKAFADVI